VLYRHGLNAIGARRSAPNAGKLGIFAVERSAEAEHLRADRVSRAESSAHRLCGWNGARTRAIAPASLVADVIAELDGARARY
jgi:hypothetical protein